MKNRGIETKVAASSGASLLVGVIFGLAHFYHWFSPPPTYVSLGLATLVTLAAGWLAPHTHLRPPLTLSADDLKLVKAVAAWLKGEPPPSLAALDKALTEPPAGKAP